MGILNGFIRTRKHRKTSEGYVWQSEDTHESSVIFDDGQTLTEKMTNHNHSDLRSSNNDYTLSMQGDGNLVLYDTNTTNPIWAMNDIINKVITTDQDPGVNANVSYKNGSIICVYE